MNEVQIIFVAFISAVMCLIWMLFGPCIRRAVHDYQFRAYNRRRAARRERLDNSRNRPKN